MEDWAGWVAPIATTLAACMTAANLGPRVTGWGFIVFTVGSLAWTAFGVATGQGNLVWQNIVLTLINLVGVWRWLGREARYARGGSHAAVASERVIAAPSLFPVSRFSGCPVHTADGETVAETVDAMADRDDGRIRYIVCREGGVGGVGERLHRLEWSEIAADTEGFSTTLTADALRARRELEPDRWPTR